MPPSTDVVQFTSSALMRDFAVTIVMVLTLLTVRALSLRGLRMRGVGGEELRRWAAGTRSFVVVAILAGAAVIWFAELKTFALSLVAVAAAAVLATKELIMCVGGALVRTTSRSFEIGDRIEVHGVRGDVIDTSLLTTTILEIGMEGMGHHQTGRAVTIPNALFLSSHVVNETYTDQYVLHTFSVLASMADWVRAESAMLAAAQIEHASYAEEAKTHFERVMGERGIEIPTLAPRVLLQVESPTEIRVVARLPVPAKRRGRVEQAILRRYLDQMTGQTSTTMSDPSVAF
jgi:small-conductance mechanosensitive channel